MSYQTTECGTDTVGWCCLSHPDYSYEELLALDEGYRLMEAKQQVVVKQELVKVRRPARLPGFPYSLPYALPFAISLNSFH